MRSLRETVGRVPDRTGAERREEPEAEPEPEPDLDEEIAAEGSGIYECATCPNSYDAPGDEFVSLSITFHGQETEPDPTLDLSICPECSKNKPIEDLVVAWDLNVLEILDE